MNKFERISSFEKLSENDSRKLYGGDEELQDSFGTTTTVSCTVTTNTAGCTCNNNVPDSCGDVGQGTECVKD